jgi:hypothetical protein
MVWRGSVSQNQSLGNDEGIDKQSTTVLKHLFLLLLHVWHRQPLEVMTMVNCHNCLWTCNHIIQASRVAYQHDSACSGSVDH